MFKGQFEHALDAKGRVALPAAFRRELSERGDELLVVTRHIQEPCLVAYPRSSWIAFETRLAEKSQFDRKVAQVRRLMVGRAMDCPVDKVGRVLLPERLRKGADIQRELVWMGQLDWIEIWAPAALEAVAPMEGDVEVDDETVARLVELGL